MKKFLVTLLSVLILVTGAAFVVACNKDDNVNVLKTYLLKQEGQPVDDEFVLPNKISGKDVSWASDDTSAIKIENGEDCYIAKVTMGDDTKIVTLTATQGEYTKDFKVTVMEMDVYYLLDKYKFPQEGTSVSANFDLPTTFTNKGATAKVTWKIDEKYAEYARINDEGDKCIVVPTSTNPKVVISATFEYKNVETTAEYTMTVSLHREHLEEVNYWYTNEGVTIEIKGYVVAIHEASTQYKNATIYVIDDDFCTGYYLFRVKAEDVKNIELLEPGVHITATNTTNQNYNGLWETNAGGNLVVDKDENGNIIKIDNVLEKVYAIDNDLLAHAPAAVYNESRMVSLDKWEVVSKPDSAPAKGATGTLFTLKKGDVEVAVVVSKYLGGVYDTNNTEDPVYKALIDLYTSVNVGDVISLKGILSNYKGYQIMPLSAADVTKGGEATTAPEFCATVKTAIEAVQGVFTKDGITEDKTINIPQTTGVTITAKLLNESSTAVTLDGNVITVKAGNEENVGVQITYTVGDYSTVTFHNIHVLTQAEADKAAAKAAVKAELEKVKATLTVEGDTTLATATAENVTLIWEPKIGTTLPAGVTINAGKLNVETPPAEDLTVVLTVTAICGEEKDAKDVTVTIKAAEVENDNLTLTSTSLTVLDPDAASGYVKYNGTHTVGDYSVTTNQIMPNEYQGKNVLQLQAKNATLTVTGNFTKVVLTIVSTYDFDNDGNQIYVYAGTTKLTATLKDTATEGNVKTYTVEYTGIAAGEQTIKVAKETSYAGYVQSIEFEVVKENTLDLTNESLSILDETQASGYAKYNGTHTVGDYSVTTNQIMPNEYQGKNVLQLQAKNATLTVTGNFTKVVLTIVSTYDFDNDGNQIYVYAGTTKLTATLKDTATEGNVKTYTVEYTGIAAGEQTIKVAKETSYAGYVQSIVLTIAE
ncbi:MAG: hypothetical protein K2L12_05930 [Clostridia bacterium]|nr:hypothetical protein [Clostridia bacterium]